MATAASAIDQIYMAIKADLCAGLILPGERVNIAGYSTRFRVSKSPIRNALYRLVGERLLEAHPNDGFYRPRVIEQTLFDLYLWNEHALQFAFDQIEAVEPTSVSLPALPGSTGEIVTDVEHLFAAVAGLSGNIGCRREVQALNDQLRAIRLQESDQLPDLETEFDVLSAAWRADNLAALKDAVSSYHSRRRQSVRQLVALAYRGPAGTDLDA